MHVAVAAQQLALGNPHWADEIPEELDEVWGWRRARDDEGEEERGRVVGEVWGWSRPRGGDGNGERRSQGDMRL